jgi:glyoxylase-like metal-dependent hydrolase (beta-lactamase superfamily II)
VAVIAHDHGSVLVDAGHSPAVARSVSQAIEAAGLPAPRRLIYTHHHWDHVWGACAWPDVEIIGHRLGARILDKEAQRPWSHEYLQEGVAENPRLAPSYQARARAMPSWEGFTVRPPHTEFDEKISLPEGIDVHHVGGSHAQDSTIVSVPDSGVLLLGDSFYPPPYHLNEHGQGHDEPLIRRLLDAREFGGHEWYVDSHSNPRSRAVLQSLLETDAD